MSALIPNGKQQFLDANGKPLGAGSVTMYVPGTTTYKLTWQDQALSVVNTPVIALDAAGECIMWGIGSYRQLVKDVFGVVQWDEVTASPDAGGVSNPSAITRTTVDYVMTSQDGTVLADASGGGISITLPDSAASQGAIFAVKKTDASANLVTIVGTIDGFANRVLAARGQSVLVQADGVQYDVLAQV